MYFSITTWFMLPLLWYFLQLIPFLIIHVRDDRITLNLQILSIFFRILSIIVRSPFIRPRVSFTISHPEGHLDFFKECVSRTIIYLDFLWYLFLVGGENRRVGRVKLLVFYCFLKELSVSKKVKNMRLQSYQNERKRVGLSN